MNRRLLYAILAAVGAAAVVAGLVWRSQMAKQPDGEVRSAVVERSTMLVTVSASGRVEPRDRVDLAFNAPGRVVEVPVEVGDTVEADDILLRLDTERLALQVQQAQAKLASAEAQLAQLQGGPQEEETAAAEAKLRASQAQVSTADATRDQLERGGTDAQVAAAEADLASAITQQKVAEDTHDATMKCMTVTWQGQKRTICPGLGMPEEQARYNLQAANKALTAAQTRLDNVLAGAGAGEIRGAQANVWNAAAHRDGAQAQLDLLLSGPSDEQIAAAEARAAQARAALKLAELSLDRATLRAPFGGVVAEVNVTAGEMSPTGLPAIVLLDNSEFHVTLSVDEIDVGQLAEGQSAEVTLEALWDTVITGTVERIAPAAAPEGGVVYYEVIVALAPTDAPIRADMTANATILVEELADALTIPTWVVRVDQDTGQLYVHRQVGDDIERVDVELGVRHEGTAQVLDGLSEGDEVVRVQESPQFDFRLQHP